MSNHLIADLVLLSLILIVCLILACGLCFICRAIFFKARHVPRRHLKYQIPNVLSGLRPSGSSEMIFSGSSNSSGPVLSRGESTASLVNEDSFQTLAQEESTSTIQSRKVKLVDDYPEVGTFCTFSTQPKHVADAEHLNKLYQDPSSPPVITPTLHTWAV